MITKLEPALLLRLKTTSRRRAKSVLTHLMKQQLRKQWERWREFILFVLFGSLNTLLSTALYLLLLLFLLYPAAYTVAYVCGIGMSYCLHVRFVFKERVRLRTALRYPLVYVVQYALGMLLLLVLVEAARIPEWLAPFIIAVLMIPVAYVLSRYIIKEPPSAQSQADAEARSSANL